ncbi:MAG: hypothetical protein NT023_02165 [Armatimonadetes bacterium]|nr:hypothetical protein [Armatimonadota bacterium]
MLRYLNMFILIGICLIGVSIAGFATGSKFVTEPGQPINPLSSFVYFGVGILMLLNGYVTIRLSHSSQQKSPPKEDPQTKE